MTVDGTALVVIVALALVTLACRLAGVWLLERVTPSRQLEAALHQMPGALLVALVAPAAVQAGFAAVPALAATVAVIRRTGNLLLATVVGVLTIWIARHLLP